MQDEPKVGKPVSVYLTPEEDADLAEAVRRLGRKKSALIKDAMRLAGLISRKELGGD